MGGAAATPANRITTPPAAAYTPADSLRFDKTFAQTFAITHSETYQPLANREFVALVDGREIHGMTDADGLAHIEAPSMDSLISLHVLFKSPKRTLAELSEKSQ
ncbi:hypothetical protein D9M71_402050 [compost metagenome]